MQIFELVRTLSFVGFLSFDSRTRLEGNQVYTIHCVDNIEYKHHVEHRIDKQHIW